MSQWLQWNFLHHFVIFYTHFFIHKEKIPWISSRRWIHDSLFLVKTWLIYNSVKTLEKVIMCIFLSSFYEKTQDCRDKVNLPHVEPELLGGAPSEGVSLRDPSLYLREKNNTDVIWNVVDSIRKTKFFHVIVKNYIFISIVALGFYIIFVVVVVDF